MAGSSIPLYCWDTSIFLAWLKKETSRKPGEWDGIVGCIDQLKKREIRIMTSVLTFAEISTAKMPVGADTMLEEFMQRPNVNKIGVDMRIAKLARDLRDYYIKADANGLTLSVPDALQVATAILYRANEFHTFDEHDDRKYKFLGLIPLSGNVGGHALKICKPSQPQITLPNLGM